MDPNDRFIPADEVASQMGTGVDPANNALLQALTQIRQTQARPLIADNPFAQLGSGLEGLAAGFRGQVNPAVQQALAVRQQETQSALGQATLGLGIANLGARTKNEERLAQQFRTEKMLGIAKDLMTSEDPAQNTLGAQFLSNSLQSIGVKVDPAALTDIGRKPLKSDEVNAIGRDLIGGMPSATAATLYKRSPATIDMIRQIPDKPEWRSAIGMKTQAELDRQAIETNTASLKNLKDTFEYFHPEVTKEVLAQTKVAFPTKTYQDLSPTDQAEMVRRAEYATLDRQNRHFDYTQQALLDKPIPLGQKQLIVDPRTYRTPAAPLSQRSIEANGLVEIPDLQTRRALPAMQTLGETIQRVMEIHARHPEYWPPAMLGQDGRPLTIANAANIRLAQARMAANQGVDPDLAAIRASMADIVKLATTAGASSRFSNYIAQLEKDAAGWDLPGTRESKFMQLNTSLQRINGQLMALGLDRLPSVVTLPDGRRVRVPGGR